MTPARQMNVVKVRDVVKMLHGDNPPKLRPGVVIKIESGIAWVSFGTGQARAAGVAFVEVPHRARRTKAMGLTKKTRFHAGDDYRSFSVREVAVAPRLGTTPDLVFAELRQLHKKGE